MNINIPATDIPLSNYKYLLCLLVIGVLSTNPCVQMLTCNLRSQSVLKTELISIESVSFGALIIPIVYSP